MLSEKKLTKKAITRAFAKAHAYRETRRQTQEEEPISWVSFPKHKAWVCAAAKRGTDRWLKFYVYPHKKHYLTTFFDLSEVVCAAKLLGLQVCRTFEKDMLHKTVVLPISPERSSLKKNRKFKPLDDGRNRAENETGLYYYSYYWGYILNRSISIPAWDLSYGYQSKVVTYKRRRPAPPGDVFSEIEQDETIDELYEQSLASEQSMLPCSSCSFFAQDANFCAVNPTFLHNPNKCPDFSPILTPGSK